MDEQEGIAVPIEDLVRPPLVSERYYAKRAYMADIAGFLGHDQLVLQHSNRLIVVCISPHHEIITKHKTVVSVNYQISDKTNRLDSIPTGKGKKNCQFVTELNNLCFVTCDDGSRYNFVSCVRGWLLEVNTRLLLSPSLLSSKPLSEGYVAIINPKSTEFDSCMHHLLSPNQYDDVLRARTSASVLSMLSASSVET